MILRHCKRADIYDLNKELLCQANVIGDVEGDTAMLRFNGSLDETLRTEVIVTFLDGAQGMVSCMCALTDYEEERDEEDGHIISSVKCEIQEELDAVQRRNDIKIPVYIKATANYLNRDGGLERADVAVLDISAGGLFCLSRAELKEGMIFSLPLPDLGIILDARILRIQTPHSYRSEFPEDSPYFGYGCQFVDLSRAAEGALRKFIFQKDLRKKKNLEGAESMFLPEIDL